MPVNQETAAVRTVRQMCRLPWSQGGRSCLSLIPIVRTTVYGTLCFHITFPAIFNTAQYFIRTEYTYTILCYFVQCPLVAVFMMCAHNMLFVSYTLSLVLALKARKTLSNNILHTPKCAHTHNSHVILYYYYYNTRTIQQYISLNSPSYITSTAVQHSSLKLKTHEKIVIQVEFNLHYQIIILFQ